ncbi:DegT/DnrJ/EryC1/StrS family aminotransferase [Candidatus Woesearchaeota archaeon]|nr:DegT/DnrJ/EryC1/StrS family aminotransferase [Candidatus Woesearchaeota archaeon]
MKIPLCKIYVDNDELDSVKEVFDSGWLAHGPKNKELEEKFSKEIGTKYASCVNSCASALQTAIMANNLKGEIILPSFTFAASANAIIHAGCIPIFADINPVTFNIDPEDIERKISKKTVAIMPVHYAGLICDMEKIMKISEKYNLKIIEDSAECIGAEINGKKAGSFGIGCFSFYPTKNITTGEGGMITFDDEELMIKINSIKSHGLIKPTFERETDGKKWYRDAITPGFNFRMSDINAAIGISQMKKLERANSLRREHAMYLNKNLQKEVKDYIDVPIVNDIKTHVYQMYVIKVKEESKRDLLLDYLNDNGIGASVHFEPPVHMQTYYKNNFPSKLPVTEKICKQVITLPMFPDLKEEELNYIIIKIKEFFENDN